MIVTNNQRQLLCPSCGSVMKQVRVAMPGAPYAAIFVCLYCNELEAAVLDALGEAAGASDQAGGFVPQIQPDSP
jgi:hypothetical protein